MGISNHMIIQNCKTKILYVFGNNYYGQLGLSNNHNQDTPQKNCFFDNEKILHIAIGSYHSIIATKKGLWSFGHNEKGQLGIGNSLNQNSPQKISFFDHEKILQISLGFKHSLVLTNNGLYAFGNNHHGQLGLSHFTNQLSPKKVHFFDNHEILQICCGCSHSFVLTRKGLYSFGWNENGQLGLSNTSQNQSIPQKILFFEEFHEKIIQVTSGINHSFVLTQNGLYGFGENESGQLGLPNKHDQSSPQKIDFFDDHQILQVSLGRSHSLVLTKKGLYSFGLNEYTTNNTPDSETFEFHASKNIPKRLSFFVHHNILQIYVGYHHSFVLTKKGLFAFGNNHYGQLGISNHEFQSIPQKLSLFDNEDFLLPNRNEIQEDSNHSESKEAFRHLLTEILTRSIYTDFTINIENTHFLAHRCILSIRCPELLTFSFDSLKISPTNLQKILNFIYTNNIELEDNVKQPNNRKKSDPHLNLTKSDLKNFELKNSDLKNSKLNNSDLKNLELKNSKLNNSDLKNSKLKNSELKNLELKNSKLNNSDLKNFELKNDELKIPELKVKDPEVKNPYLTKSLLGNSRVTKTTDIKKSNLDLKSLNINLNTPDFKNSNPDLKPPNSSEVQKYNPDLKPHDINLNPSNSNLNSNFDFKKSQNFLNIATFNDFEYISQRSIIEIYSICEKLKFILLQSFCLNLFIKNLTASNVSISLFDSLEFGCTQLRDECFLFLSKNKPKFSKDLLEKLSKYPDILFLMANQFSLDNEERILIKKNRVNILRHLLRDNSLKELMKQLYKQREKTGDFTILVSGKPVKVHKCILTPQWEFFSKVLLKEPEHNIEGIDSVLFEELIKVFYLGIGDHLDFNLSQIYTLLSLADEYGFDPNFVHYLSTSLSRSNWKDLFLLGTQFNDTNFKQTALQKMKQSPEAVTFLFDLHQTQIEKNLTLKNTISKLNENVKHLTHKNHILEENLKECKDLYLKLEHDNYKLKKMIKKLQPKEK